MCTVPTTYVLSKNKKNIKIFQLKIFISTAKIIYCILHGRVFVMLEQFLLIFSFKEVYSPNFHTKWILKSNGMARGLN